MYPRIPRIRGSHFGNHRTTPSRLTNKENIQTCRCNECDWKEDCSYVLDGAAPAGLDKVAQVVQVTSVASCVWNFITMIGYGETLAVRVARSFRELLA
jgi:hypothetical protein